MGVPAFFRWLSKKYPSVIVHCIEEKPKHLDGTTVPVDSSQPNPNGIEFDNLYLDMNGIIHPCTHPEDRPAPQNEDEMMEAIFDCIDRLVRIVRPRKLLYMAIDGVAPRAKMNQQRSRRFRASKETVEKVQEVARIREMMIEKGLKVPPPKEKGSHFDSNCITPGTPFMARLSSCLDYYIHDRLNNDPGWKNIKVILSDANVPGEGEHKIMDYIRRQRAQPNHDPNTQHCLCGADADLIMLGLATHEPNFTIIREEFKPNKPHPCDICGAVGHEMKDCVGIESEVSSTPGAPEFAAEQEFIFVRLNVLREYLERELHMPGLPFKYDFERAVDDWVFMCFFVGNDFLPHLPSLEIREGAIDKLIELYKKTVYKTGGYLTDSGDVNLDRVQLIMADLGEMEDEIFKKRQQTELFFKERDKQKKRREKMFKESNSGPAWLPQGQFAPQPLGQINPVQNVRREAYNMRVAGMQANSHLSRMGQQASSGPGGQKRKIDEVESDEEEPETPDEVRLWETGFKDRYYESKFDVGPDNHAFRHSVALQYVRGLCWVLRYYYQGCASWKWYFPYHYAPFASDFQNISGLSTEFERGTLPFRPLEQLMGVFPAASSSHVPPPWAELMSDPDSPIIDFYPEDFKIDLNGKKFAWQGVALLPFVDEKRLFKALEPYYTMLTDAEKRRNIKGDDRLYLSIHHTSHSFFLELYTNNDNFSTEVEIAVDGMRGTVLLAENCVKQGGSLPSPVQGLPVVRCNSVVAVRFRDPAYSETFIFKASRLNGAKEPAKVLKPEGMDSSTPYRPVIGMARRDQQARVGVAGHRMLNHHSPQSTGPGIYSNVPPPLMRSPFIASTPVYYGNTRGRNREQHSNDNRGRTRFGPDKDKRSTSSRFTPYQTDRNVGGSRPPGYNTNNQSQEYKTYSSSESSTNRNRGNFGSQSSLSRSSYSSQGSSGRGSFGNLNASGRSSYTGQSNYGSYSSYSSPSQQSRNNNSGYNSQGGRNSGYNASQEGRNSGYNTPQREKNPRNSSNPSRQYSQGNSGGSGYWKSGSSY